jgi:hypothetical protein
MVSMALDLNPVILWNIIFTSAIFILGMVVYEKTRNLASFFIGIAFLLFAVSHVITLVGSGLSQELLLLIIRTFAYVVVIFALLCIGFISCKTTRVAS